MRFFQCFQTDEEKFARFFHRVLSGALEDAKSSLHEGRAILQFLNCAFGSLEIDLVRKQVQSLVSLQIWHCLSEVLFVDICDLSSIMYSGKIKVHYFLRQGRREEEFIQCPKWKKFWRNMVKKEAKESEEKRMQNQFNRSFFHNLINNFMTLLEEQDYMQPELNPEFLKYVERFMEIMIDLQALLPTRRYLNTLIDDMHLIVRCQMSPLLEHGDGHLFSQLLDRLKFYTNFEIDNETGNSMSELDVMQAHYQKITRLQVKVFSAVPDLRQFSLSNVCNIDTRGALLKHFKQLDSEQLRDLASTLHLIVKDDEDVNDHFILEVMVNKYEKRVSQIKQLNAMALYPTEDIIWDENVVPSDYHSASGQVLALPKLNLQFLTLHDYLLRNFQLFRLESTCKEDFST